MTKESGFSNDPIKNTLETIRDLEERAIRDGGILGPSESVDDQITPGRVVHVTHHIFGGRVAPAHGLVEFGKWNTDQARLVLERSVWAVHNIFDARPELKEMFLLGEPEASLRYLKDKKHTESLNDLLSLWSEKLSGREFKDNELLEDGAIRFETLVDYLSPGFDVEIRGELMNDWTELLPEWGKKRKALWNELKDRVYVHSMKLIWENNPLNENHPLFGYSPVDVVERKRNSIGNRLSRRFR